MNTPNPLIPQGTFLARSKSHVRIAVFTILGVHVVLLGALLLQGCKRTTDSPSAETTNASVYPDWVEPTNALPVTPVIVDPTPLPPPPVPATVQTQLPLETPVASLPPEGIRPSAFDPSGFRPPPSPPPAGGVREHVIVRGDTFSDLAKKYNVTVRAIAEANPGVEPRQLKIGQKLVIPPPMPDAGGSPLSGVTSFTNGDNVYTVKSGDTLIKIARDHGTSVKAIQAANNLSTTRIKVGQKLNIPSRSNGFPAPAEGTPLPAFP